jgi:hypothetical protein
VAPLVFDRDEDGFLEWLARGRGYVINASRSRSDLEGTKLHRADCSTIQPGSGGGSLQTDAYFKVCSWDPKELDVWARDYHGPGLRAMRCQICNPSALGLT